MPLSLQPIICQNITYQEGLLWQQKAREKILKQKSKDLGFLFFCEHKKTIITLGKNSNRDFLKASAEELEELDIELHKTHRGGQITLHTPGQWVVYPVFYLRSTKLSVKSYVGKLQQALIDVLGGLHIEALSHKEYPGVWVTKKNPPTESWSKIAAIGLAIREGITEHGFSLNVNCNLELFKLIVPCGIPLDHRRGITHILKEQPQLSHHTDLMNHLTAPLLKALSHHLEAPMQKVQRSTDLKSTWL